MQHLSELIKQGLLSKREVTRITKRVKKFEADKKSKAKYNEESYQQDEVFEYKDEENTEGI
jgi:hypothetical protein